MKNVLSRRPVSRRPISGLFFAFVLLAVVLSGCSVGSVKSPVQIVATPAGDMDLVNVFMTTNPMGLDSGTPTPRNIPLNTPKIYLGLRFRSTGTNVDKFKIDYEVLYKGLPLDTEFDSQPASWTEQSSQSTVVIMPVRKADGTPFEPGQYEGRILIDGNLIATIEWQVGSEE